VVFVGFTGLGLVLFAGIVDTFGFILTGVSTLVGAEGASFLGVSSLKAQTRIITLITKTANATPNIAIFWYAKANRIANMPSASNTILNTISSELAIINTYNL